MTPPDLSSGTDLPLEWRAAWLPVLGRTAPVLLFVALTLVIGACAAVLSLFSPVPGGLLLAALILSLDELFFPVHYRIDEGYVRARTLLRTRRHAWSEFTDVCETRYGVLLRSPLRRSLHLLATDCRAEAMRRARLALPDRTAIG